MIYLKLFLQFLEIGAVSFGGGYGMISLIREAVLSNGWLTDSEFMSLIAVSESTPGPIAINIATFVGSSQGGLLGSLFATLGVVLPSFIIILLISALMRNFLKYAGVKGFLSGVRPCVVALIIATSLIMSLSLFLNLNVIGDSISPDYKAISIFVVLFAVSFIIKKALKKKLSPIVLIIISAGLGMLFYGL